MVDELDREEKNNYRLEVEARDGGSPAHTATVTLVVDVLDVNDNQPLFDDCNMTAVVQVFFVLA